MLAPPGILDPTWHVRALVTGRPRPDGLRPARRNSINLVEKLASAQIAIFVFKRHASPPDRLCVGSRVFCPHRREDVLNNGVPLAVATAEAALELGQAQPSLRLPPPGK